MNWVELTSHLIDRHGQNPYYVDELDADRCRKLHRALHTASSYHRHEEGDE